MFINPAQGYISDLYGVRINPVLKTEEFHNGIDIAVPIGTELVAVLDGVVTEVGTSPTFGNYIKYETNNDYIIMYAHLDKTLVDTGTSFKQGDVIALSGNSGLTTGPHLHYTIWYNLETVDPIDYVDLPFFNDL